MWLDGLRWPYRRVRGARGDRSDPRSCSRIAEPQRHPPGSHQEWHDAPARRRPAPGDRGHDLDPGTAEGLQVMVFAILTVLVMGGIAYAQFKEGVFTAFVMFVNVIIASVVACNFFEPLADVAGGIFAGSFMEGIEDFVMLVLVFAATLGALRWATNNIAVSHLEYHPILYQGGAVVCGMLTGYVLCGFFIVAMPTLPLHENFMYLAAEITMEPSFQA